MQNFLVYHFIHEYAFFPALKPHSSNITEKSVFFDMMVKDTKTASTIQHHNTLNVENASDEMSNVATSTYSKKR